MTRLKIVIILSSHLLQATHSTPPFKIVGYSDSEARSRLSGVRSTFGTVDYNHSRGHDHFSRYRKKSSNSVLLACLLQAPVPSTLARQSRGISKAINIIVKSPQQILNRKIRLSNVWLVPDANIISRYEVDILSVPIESLVDSEKLDTATVKRDQINLGGVKDSPTQNTFDQRTIGLKIWRFLWKGWKNDHSMKECRLASDSSSKLHQLSTLLHEHALYSSQWDEIEYEDVEGTKTKNSGRNYASWTIAGLIMALAEEASDLDVQVDSKNSSPLWDRKIDRICINFSRLGFKPLRMGGLGKAIRLNTPSMDLFDKDPVADSLYRRETVTPSPDEAFDIIDMNNSGTLDVDELALALRIAARDQKKGSIEEASKKSTAIVANLARRLLRLYDSNGDGVVDREEYKEMVKDMTSLRTARQVQKFENMKVERGKNELRKNRKRFNLVAAYKLLTLVGRMLLASPWIKRVVVNDSKTPFGEFKTSSGHTDSSSIPDNDHFSFQPVLSESVVKDASRGEIVISDLKLDLRRLIFGAFPLVKRITPGGPLILDPFTITVSASFHREDIISSSLLDAGLRLLVARALRRRVRSLRDFLDGAVFHGRAWTMASEEAPVVEVPKLTNVEFDSEDRLIITGRAVVRASPDQPYIENSFKLRAKLGTREGGQFIRLQDPELAIGIECPREWEKFILLLHKNFKIMVPDRPEPIDLFFPLVSPLKATDQDGFNLGADNRIKSIFIKDGALHFEVSAILRPGRFLGNHYVAFVVPNRTFIITMDRVLEGIRVARRNKRERKEAQRAKASKGMQQVNEQHDNSELHVSSSTSEGNDSGTSKGPPVVPEKSPQSKQTLSAIDRVATDVTIKRPNFFSRFLEGYMEAAREETEEERNERLSKAIGKFFGTLESENE